MKFMRKLLTSFLLLALTAVTTALPIEPSFGKSCESVHRIHALELPTVQKWLQWEINPTYEKWAQERPSSPLPISLVYGNTLKVETLGKTEVQGLEDVLNTESIQLPWYKHPYNQDAKVPNFDMPIFEYGVAYHTASRTIVTEINGRLVSLKMATDRPFGPKKDQQPGKVQLDADLKYSVARSKVILKIDEQIGLDPKLIAQKEIAAVIDQKTGNGYLFRDMTPLQDGHYYLPGHQIPYIGKTIARRYRTRPTEFWNAHWAAALGRFQAKLLYRYGIEVRAVNPQNFLVQLNSKLKPTGVLIWRDLAESHLVEPIASALGLKDFVARDQANGGWGVHQEVKIDNTNIYWIFNHVKTTITGEGQKLWSETHNLAYRQELESALGISIPADADLKSYLNQELKKGSDSLLIQKILEWHQRQRQTQNQIHKAS